MSINIHNYEAWFLDYHEGRLDPAATRELMLFLEQNPQLKEEFESFENISLDDSTETKYDDKASLKRYVTPVNPNNFDEVAAQSVDGTLDGGMQKELEKFIKLNPQYEKDLELYTKTKLVPEASIIFENKESLKRERRRPVAWYYWSAAASVAIIVIVYFFISKPKTDTNALVHTNVTVDTTQKRTASVPPVNINAPVTNAVQNTVAHSNQQVQKQNSPLFVKRNNNPALQLQAPNVTAPNDSVAIMPQHKYISPIHDTIQHKEFVGTDSVPTKKDSLLISVSTVVALNWDTLQPSKPHGFQKLLYAVSNPFRSIGKLFSHGIDIRKCYNKDNDKVIAYQIDLGDTRYTLALRNSY